MNGRARARTHAFNLRTREAEAGGSISEFKAKLVYIVNSKPSRKKKRKEDIHNTKISTIHHYVIMRCITHTIPLLCIIPLL